LIWADYLIIGIILLSALISLVRGFIREGLSLIAWILALWVAISFSPRGVEWLPDNAPLSPPLQQAIVFLVLMVGTLLAAAIINSMLIRLVEKTGLGGIDRLLGMIFGIARGVTMVTGLVFLAGMTPLSHHPWWQDSQLLAHFQVLALWVQSLIPPDIVNPIRL
jgi:membrane protein required for colicin V production